MSVVIEDKARIPIRPLSYDNKELAIAKELIIDYRNYAAYVKTENGEIHNVSASDAAISAILEHIKTHPEIITSASVTKPDQSTISISGAITDIYTILEKGVEIDSTLSISGKAADAKIVGDELAKKSDSGHTHTSSQITDFTTKLESHIEENPTIVTDRTVLNGNQESVTITQAIGDLYGLIKQAVSGSVAIDKTLAKSDFAADSKTVGDKLKNKSDVGHGHEIANINGLELALSGKANSTHDHDMSDITGLSNALSGKASSIHTHTSDDITDLSDLLDGKANISHEHTSADITDLQAKLNGKANSSHSHTMIQVTGLSDALAGKSDSDHTHKYAGSSYAGGPATSALKLSNSKTIGVTLNGIAGAVGFDGSSNISIGASGILPVNKGGTGSSDPETALSNLGGITKTEIADIQDQINGKASSSHSHYISDISNLSNSLNGKADSVHSHSMVDITGLSNALSGKADSVHDHSMGDITGLSNALSGKANSVHSHSMGDITGLSNALSGKASSTHSHDIEDITGLSDSLAGKSNTGHGHYYAGSSGIGGAANSAVKLETARTVKVNLSSTSASNFDGSTNITPGVSGTLPIVNGGTGKTTASEARAALGAASSSDLSSLSTKVNGLKYAGASTAGGAATSAEKLKTAKTVKVDLSSTSASNFDGSANITPGVSGTLPIANGGTGNSSASKALAALGGMPSFLNSHLWIVYSKNPYSFKYQNTKTITIIGSLGTYATYPDITIYKNLKYDLSEKKSTGSLNSGLLIKTIGSLDTLKKVFENYPLSFINTKEYGYVMIDDVLIVDSYTVDKTAGSSRGNVKVTLHDTYKIKSIANDNITIHYEISSTNPSVNSEYAELVI